MTNNIFKESITIITLITQMLRRVIIVTSLIVGLLIPSLMLLWMKPVVDVDEVEILLGLGTEIS
jgi:uncharacterized membrane protein (Fun14 family)